MAQWIPKTAWKASSLNKRYGPQYMTQGYPVAQDPDRVLASYAAMASQSSPSEKVFKQKLQAALNASRGCASPGAVVIDVRDGPERHLKPLSSPVVVALHPHDLLSGAARPILPQNKAESKLFVVASERGRALNSLDALRRWGYDSVQCVEYDVVAGVLKALDAE